VKTWTITASAGAGGTITPTGAVIVNQGTSKTFTVKANTGYMIDTVKIDGTDVATTGTYTFANVAADHTIAATFKVAYTITATAGTGGTISPSGAVLVGTGGSKTFTVAASTGYNIASVKVDGVEVVLEEGGTYTFTNVTAKHTIAATFSLITY
jgi:hypothetical protein